jgi:hypothetical protein
MPEPMAQSCGNCIILLKLKSETNDAAHMYTTTTGKKINISNTN